MSTPIKQRRRRIASDEAHAWARNLRLGKNWAAKYILCMLSLYVNGDGACFVSIPQLSDDCELSAQTVRSRLAWLNQIGAIARRPQWLDENGQRNGNGKGRRTSDEIVLLLDADIESIEAAAVPPDPMPQTGPPPMPQTGSDEPEDSVSPMVRTPPTLQLCRGAESSEPEPDPEPEEPPQPPQGGGQVADEEFEQQIADAQQLYPIPITNLPRFRSVWAAQERTQRPKILTAMRGFAIFIAECERKKKPRAVKDADRWVDSGMWQGYLGGGAKIETVEKRQVYPRDSITAKAIAVLYAIAGKTSFLQANMLIADGVWYRRAITVQLNALAQAPTEREWPHLSFPQASAWNGLLDEFMTLQVWTRLKEGSRAPWPWPPSKDGKIYASTGPPSTLMSAQDETDLDQLGKMG